MKPAAVKAKPAKAVAVKAKLTKPSYPPPAYDRALVAKQLAKVRAFCAELPGTVERPSHGSPTFLIDGKRAFAYFLDNHHGDGRLALWCAAPDGAQGMLIDSAPERYFRPPYVGHRGWVGVHLDRGTPWREIASVLEAAHAHRMPARKPR